MPIRILSLVLFLSVMYACGNQQANKNQTPEGNKEIKTESAPFSLEAPSNGSRINWGDTLNIAFKPTSDSVKVDSSSLLIGGETFTSQHQELSYKWVVPENTRVGNTPIVLTVWHDGKNTKLNTTVKVHPPSPIFFDYEVVNTYPHDDNAYTQGLFFYDGFLYEGTGQNGKSTLRKVELKTGKVLKSVPLENEYFGEGIVLLKGKIYQLTWESRKGFVYDANTFERIGEFPYSTEGWGLATDGKHLIMSDGSSIIHFIDPETFREVRNIEVYTNKGAIIHLNELEYINDEIWANVFMQDTVISIDPATGKVTRVIDLRNLLPTNLHTANTDVLNGIAYDKSRNGNLYVTGKNWPKLYEIKLIQRKYN